MCHYLTVQVNSCNYALQREGENIGPPISYTAQKFLNKLLLNSPCHSLSHRLTPVADDRPLDERSGWIDGRVCHTQLESHIMPVSQAFI